MVDAVCYPEPGRCAPDVVEGCCDDWPTHPRELRIRARELAWSTLRLLTAGRTGNCRVVYRPCVDEPCGTCTDTYRTGLPWTPRVVDGSWTNVTCNPDGCSCTPLSEIRLPSQGHDVEVLVDGQPFSYWKQYGPSILRTDGQHWPSCQNLDVDERKPGSFAVLYTPGAPLGDAGEWAYATLACEYAKACAGGVCRLPSTVTSISRQGVTMELAAGLFDGGLTGIREVDVFIASLNPNRLKVPPRVWSPDVKMGRWAT